MPDSPQATRSIAPPRADDQALHRSGAVARMLRMPVATLRVWERRYSLTHPALSPSGQRLYSADDVRRLALLKQLSDLGHAIGSLATLDMAQLQHVAATHAQVLSATRGGAPLLVPSTTPTAAVGRPVRLAVIGSALGRRLQRPALLQRLGAAVELLGPFDDLAQAAAAVGPEQVDGLLLHEPQLQDGWLAQLEAAAPAWTALPKAVLYGFAPDPVCEALAIAGITLLREPQPDAVLAQWLQSLIAATRARNPGAARAPAPPRPAGHRSVPPRRWDDAALADFAGLSSTIACECPRHVAELLVQLSHFEAYSAQCENRSPSDAELHAYLRDVAASARASFEAALEHVALHEGLTLPDGLPAPSTNRA